MCAAHQDQEEIPYFQRVPEAYLQVNMPNLTAQVVEMALNYKP